ncbi:MAG: DUF2341 domain-containing protein [Candidatus Falkowbacteria bacterium]
MQKIKGYFSNLFVKLGLLILFLLAVFGYTQGRFIFVQAVANEINIYPGNFTVEGGASEFVWQNPENTFVQDLGANAQFGEFNIENSAYISLRTFEEITPASAEASAGKNDNDEPTAEEIPADESDNNDNMDTIDTDELITDDDNSVGTDGIVEIVDPDNAPDGTGEVSGGNEESGNSTSADNPETTSAPESADTPAAESAPEASLAPAPESASAATDSGSGGETGRIWDKIRSLAVYLDFFRSKLVLAQENLNSFINPEPEDEESGSVPPADDNNFAVGSDLIKQSLVFSDFFVPAEYRDNEIKDLNLRVSLAARSDFADDYIRLEYRTGNGWRLLGEINTLTDIANSLNNGYFAFPLPATVGWDEIKDLAIRVNYINTDAPGMRAGKQLEIYLDALWLEIGQACLPDRQEGAEEEESEFIEEEATTTEEIMEEESDEPVIDYSADFELTSLDDKKDFKNSEQPQLKLRFKKKRSTLEGLGAGLMSVFRDEYEGIEIKTEVYGPAGERLEDMRFGVRYQGNGEFELSLPETGRRFRPGKYRLKIKIGSETLTQGTDIDYTEEFTWGVLALNVDKSIYAPGETAYLQMAVLDETGNTICHADYLELALTDPDGETVYLSNTNGLIVENPECGPNNVIDSPDYFGFYDTGKEGEYKMTLKAQTSNGEYEITDVFEVRAAEAVPFDIERTGPTRIYPWADYEMKFKIRPRVDFRGNFIEVLPPGFKVVEQKRDGAVVKSMTRRQTDPAGNDEQEIIWRVNWEKDREYILSYTFDAPNISPEFYLLGPAKALGRFWTEDEIGAHEELTDFTEIRQWQIASDDQVIFTSSDTFDVPAGVTSITAKVWGAGGGGGGCDNDPADGGNGGGGGFITGTITVTPGETLNIDVGTGGSGGTGGSNQGGDGGGGGGYSAVRRGVSYLFVAGAGAGGGGGDDNTAMPGGDGGVGGGVIGGTGGNAGDARGGAGGTQTSGGARGNCDYVGQNGSFLTGGNGYDDGGGGTNGGVPGGGRGGDNQSVGSDSGGGGGGGAGYYGGGSGCSDQTTDGAGGGGGGSSWAVATAWATSTYSGSGRTTGSSTDPDYAGNAGQGGTGGANNNDPGVAGNPGRVVIIYTIPTEMTVSATGTQVSTIDINSEDNYVGGAFVLNNTATGTLTVNDITITENGTVDANTSLENIRLYYDIDSSDPYDCGSESYDGDELQFGATSTNFSDTNGTADFSGTVNLSASTSMCVYAVLDVNSNANKDETLEIEISDPSTEVVLSSGTVEPATSIELPDTTTIYVPDTIVTADEQRMSDNSTLISNQGWTNENQVNLSALAEALSISTTTKYDYYFELLTESGTYTTSTAKPGTACVSGDAYGGCSSKIWTASASTTSWYNTDWVYRKMITINASQVETTETAFVVLATTTDADLADTGNGGHVASSTGGDIMIIDTDGVTPLDYEREYYDNTTGELVLWIETSLSSTTDKIIYIYYGNSTLVADQQNRTGTWDSNYVMIQHMNENPATSILYDSTSNNNNATDYGNPQLVTGQIGRAVDFDGTGDYAIVPDGTGSSLDSATGPGQPRTWSYWLNISVGSANKLVTDKSPSFYGYHLWSELQTGPNQYRGGVASPEISSTFNPGTGEWHYVTFVYNGAQASLYVDGTLNVGPSNQTARADDNNSLNIMGYGNNQYCAIGILDELRVMNVYRDAGWIKTEYNNQSDVSGFLGFAGEESMIDPQYEGVANITAIPDRGSSTDSSLGYKWQALACDDSGLCSFWDEFNSTLPNFKVDTAAPDAPGNLTMSATTTTSITVEFHDQASDINFSYYKIFYKAGISGVDTDDTEHEDTDLGFIDYNSTTNTTITGLIPETQYVINIWAYDLAGNKTAATEIAVWTPPAPHARARSVEFAAGNYSSSNGLSGGLTNTDLTFSAFNFELAETSAEIKNAYIIFEAQYEAYHLNSGNYTGYNLAFDVCDEPCTADAFSGTGRVLADDNTILSYDEGSSNRIRLLMDVTDEAQLAAYAGDGADLEAQVGYRLETNTATNSISVASARLIVTYSFDGDASTNLTNTVIYPLESKTSGDRGTLRALTGDDCVKSPAGSSNCPLFDYNMDIPELGTKLSQWFQVYGMNDLHGVNDLSISVNIEGTNVDSATYIHEASLGGEQGNLGRISFTGVLGYAENTAQILEYYSTSPGAATTSLIGGEVAETYTAAQSAGTKIRTVSFPIGVLTNGQSTGEASGTAEVYFPENGTGGGIVDVKKAWFRIVSNNYLSGANTVAIATEVGDNSQSTDSVYNYNAGDQVIKPSFNIIHVIPDTDYSELETANATTPKAVTLYTTNSSANQGGVSAELMITYAYTGEDSGYLSSLNLFGGQIAVNPATSSVLASTSASVFTELRGTKTVRAGALLAAYAFSAGDTTMPSTWFTLDANISTGTPVCTNAFYNHDDAVNSFTEYYRSITSALSAVNDAAYTACFSNTNGSDATAGAKTNASWLYTYQWDAPPSNLTQSDWRWYLNADAVAPGAAKAAEKTAISNINLGDILRIRMNIGITSEDLAALNKIFKLQYGEGSDCTAIAEPDWIDADSVAGSGAWRGYNNPNPIDGTAISAVLLSSSDIGGTYEEANNSAGNPNAIAVGEYGEWDWVIYNNAASSTADYCFRMVGSDGSVFYDYLSDSYPKLTTAASNTAPVSPTTLAQYRSNGTTAISNNTWINENTVQVRAAATDVNMSERIALYFEIASSSAGTFTTATSSPGSWCFPGTSWSACPSHIWAATSSLGDYRTTPFTATATIAGLPESAEGYKWQVLACDDGGACSSVWTKYNLTIPNFKVDTVAPSPPGKLTFASSTPTMIALTFGASTTEDNFYRYRIYYREGIAGVTETDSQHTDNNTLLYKNYNNIGTTTVINLSAGTDYVFNIWAYDLAGNKATCTQETVASTSMSSNPPTGYFSFGGTTARTDGSGTVDITIQVDDPDNDNHVRAKIMYKATAVCNAAQFLSGYLDPTIDDDHDNITATYGDPYVDNDYPYQIGTTTGWIITSGASDNFVLFDWLSMTDLAGFEGAYCLGLVTNDGTYDQVATHTVAIDIDNKVPDTPGDLMVESKHYDSVDLRFGDPSADTNFTEYKIFYKEGMAGVTESDMVFDKDDDPNLDWANYGTAATTTISGLNPNTDYVFNIWAYDSYGNKAVAVTEVTVKTNAAPTNISADGQYLDDGVTPITNNSWIDENNVKLKASAHDQDAADLVTFYYQIISATGTYLSALTPPANPCAYGTDYLNCQSLVWAVATTTSVLPADWYDSNWLYRKKITINASEVVADASGFAVLAATVDSDLAAKARSDGYDIIFTDSGGTTTLPYERENYDSNTGELVAWIKTNISSTTDTELYMYYGNSGSTADPATTTGVWDSSYRGVWHLPENVVDESTSIGAHKDSCSYANDGDQYGNNELSALIYRGQDFDGINDYLFIPDDNSLDLADALTMSFWMNGEITYPPAASTSVYTSAGSGTFTVPAGVTSITVKSWGGGGGGGGGADGGGTQTRNTGGAGAGGGFVLSTLSVIPGETLDILVGGGGTGGSYIADASSGGGGGGRSGVNRGAMPLVVAAGGGGGGAGANRVYTSGAPGGPGGGVSGLDGSDSTSADAGDGGTQTAGGAGGTGTNNGTAGSSLTGGAGADGLSGQGADGGGAAGGANGGGAGGLGSVTNSYAGAGGGGAGYYGGGGGGESGAAYSAGAGGGGGSSFATSTASATSTEAGSNRNAGNNDDEDYSGTAGQGGLGGDYLSAGSNGNPGRVVIEFTPAVTIAGKGSNAFQINYNTDSKLSAQINSQAVSATLTSGWHYVTLSYDRLAGGTAELKLYIDGVVAATADYSTAINTNASPIRIGEIFNGTIDELTLSSVARSSAFIQTTYNNQYDVDSFLSFGSEGTVQSFHESVLVVTISDNPDYSSGYKWQVMACDDDSDCTAWAPFNATTPNFKIDTTDPSPPGQLIEASKNSNSVTLNFGAATDEDNFTEYRIFYSTSSPVMEIDDEHNDTDLDNKYYNSTTDTTVSGLNSNTTYYFNIWAYDIMGHKASSTVTMVETEESLSTPGAIFYTKNDRAIYYQVWTGTGWGIEQSSGNLTGASDNIRHIKTLRSDDGGKVGILFRTWDGTNQEWWGTVYRFGADNFVDAERLGAVQTDGTNNQLINGCLGSLSGSEFFAVRSTSTTGALAFSWNPADGWTDEGIIPGTTGSGKMGVMNGCELIRRPDTDNYLLITFDDDADVGSMYYYGGAAYDNSAGAWTAWTENASDETDTDNYVGQAYFDPSSNTRGAIYYSNSVTNNYAYAKYFTCNDSSINYLTAEPSPATSPADWGNDFVHGEFAVNPGSTGIAYFAGRDTGGELNVYKVNASTPTIAWTASTNGDNISAGSLYSETNDAQKPFAIEFYKSGKGVVAGAAASAAARPYYSVINATTNVLSATSSIEGATLDQWVRLRFYKDPNGDEFLAVAQNDNVDYTTVFWDSGTEHFYNSGAQAWSARSAAAAVFDRDDECASYAYAKYNSGPNQPANLYQATSTYPMANQTWAASSTIKFTAGATDYDTSEVVTLYLQLIPTNDTFTTSTDESTFNACAGTVNWDNCNSKIWTIGTSGAGDYSYTPYTATATINSIASSTTGYKWQVIACDDENECSTWKAYNATIPNFYVDTEAPSAPGALNPTAKTSYSVTLTFGAATDEPLVSFSRYRIFYATSTPVAETHTEWIDTDLNFRNYNGTANTVVTGLSSSTLYYFNIWAYDRAGNKASSSIVSTTTNAVANIVQTSFLLENDDGANVNSNTAEVAASTTLSGLHLGERLNVRLQIENSGGDSAGNRVYKLQFEDYSHATGTWIDVGAATAISHNFGLSGANNDDVISSKAAFHIPTFKIGKWHENTNLTAAYTLGVAEFTELVFVVDTSHAATGTTYRLRLYNNTDGTTLSGYDNYPVFSTVGSETKRYSKGFYASPPLTTANLTYFLDPEGYDDVLTDDANRDSATSTAQYPVILFATKHTNATDAASSTWNGQSSVAPSGSNVVLQVFRFGSTNAWVTVDTETGAGANTDFTLEGTVNSSLSDYYAAGNWIYWRVYQSSGSESLRTDHYSANFAPPIPNTEQIHYRWRKDDGTETTATWLEAEDTGSATLGPQIGKGSTTRLRLAVVNIGGGAANYAYRLEYASSTDGCATPPSYWAAVPITAGGEDFEMATSSYFDDDDNTTATTSNPEGYTFVDGRMVEDSSNTSAVISLPENRYTEIEYMIAVTDNASDAGTYCFRVTNSGAELDAYDIYPIVTLSGNTNNAPVFTLGPSDNGSASTAPTVYGDPVNFTATATDADGNNYYLAVCQTAAASAGLDGAPTCPGGQWCISGAAASGAGASCSTTTLTSVEDNNWFAYACDKVPGFGLAKCSVMSQGGATASGSPFTINHPPVFTAATTTDNFKNPGGTFTVTAYATDTDVSGGADTLSLYVCTSNSASFSGCTDGTYCSEAASTSPNASCSFATTTPAPAGNWGYYAFVYDSHGLAAAANSHTNTYTVNNAAPTIGSFFLNDGDDIGLNLKDDADTIVSTIGGSIQDLNGCTDLDSVIGTIYMSEEENTCDDDPSNCYQIPYNTGATTTCTIACDPTDLTRASTTCTAAFKYFAVPTDDVYESNPWKDYNWISYILLNDGVNLAASTSGGVELGTNLALNIVEDTIDFGTWAAGQNTGMNNSTTTVENAGNSPIDVEVYGTTMFSSPPAGYDISVTQIKFNNINFNYVFETNTLDTVANPKPIELFAPRATSTAGSADDVYWGIGIPFLAVPANYFGENTFTVWIDEDDWN